MPTYFQLIQYCRLRNQVVVGMKKTSAVMAEVKIQLDQNLMYGHYIEARGPFHLHSLTLIPVWVSDYKHCEVSDEIIYPFPNFAVEIWV